VAPSQDTVAEWSPAGTPEACKAIVMIEFCALVATVMLPVSIPVEAGVKVTLRAAISPGFKIVPIAIPLKVKPGPEILIFVIVTAELVEFVNVSITFLLSPRATFPRLALDAFTLNCPGTTVASFLATAEQPD
jgi:hypothetical protein